MKRISFIAIALFTGMSVFAQMPSGKAYPDGIYVFCGKEIPRYFTYLIEKKNASGKWEKATELRAPGNAAALKTKLLNLPPYFGATMPLPIEQSDRIWTQLSKSLTADSLYAYANDPKVLAAIGCGWFDDGITANGAYQYRVSKMIQTEAAVLGEVSLSFPQNSYRGTLTTLQFTPDDDVVTIYYELSDTTSTYNLKLYRSRLHESDFREMPASAAYIRLNGKTVAVVRDETVTKGIAYSYLAIPYDALGNMGMPSDIINIYNLASTTDIGIIQELKAVADKEKRGVMLSWKVAADHYVMGYEIYRSKNFDSKYDRIATLPAGTITYFDNDVNPAEAYYYFITVNNGYASSPPSVRVPVILEGDNFNSFPPQNFTATLLENVVQLTFNSIEPDTRDYLIYRAEGYTGELKLISSITTTDSVVIFTDTLVQSINPQTYSYAVADVNTSNNISPLTERVSIQYGGGMLSAPSGIEAQVRDNGIFVVWDDMSRLSVPVTGYNLYRSTVEDKIESEPQIIATFPYNVNSYTDTLLLPGIHYRYAVESVGINGEKSDLSLHTGVTVPRQLPLSPGRILAFASGDRILLRWDNPLDPSVQSIHIYRAMLNMEAVLLKELPADQDTYEDLTAKQGEQYFYYVVTVNDRGEESKRDEPVSGKIR